MEESKDARLYRFATFEADEKTGELRKLGRRLSLQGQPLQVLLILLQRPGELVTRTEIQQRLWPEGTFVDFDHGLNSAMNKIRDALGDSASSPRFVETLAKRGYRFIAPVEVVNGQVVPRAEAANIEVAAKQELKTAAESKPAAPESRPAARSVLTRPEDVPQASRKVVGALFLLLQVMYLTFYGVALARLGAIEVVIRGVFSQAVPYVIAIGIAAVVGIPVRLYLISAMAFKAPGAREKFLRVFPVVLALDALWSLAPFLLTHWIGFGLALGSTAALLYAPFAQRSLVLMGAGQ